MANVAARHDRTDAFESRKCIICSEMLIVFLVFLS